MSGIPGVPPIQLEKITRLTGGDPGMISEMVGLFLRLAPESLQRMKQQLELQAWDVLAREAHKFRPSTMYMGMASVSGSLERVEELARNNPDPGTLARLVEEIDAECGRAFPALRLLVEGLAPSLPDAAMHAVHD